MNSGPRPAGKMITKLAVRVNRPPGSFRVEVFLLSRERVFKDARYARAHAIAIARAHTSAHDHAHSGSARARGVQGEHLGITRGWSRISGAC